MYQARHRAIEELRHQAGLVRAHGVIGVRIEIDAERWGEDLHEFVALGTAVRSRKGPLLSAGRPFSSHLSGQGVAALLAAGYRPQSLVMGAAVWGVPVVDPIPRMGRGASRGELTRITDELTAARELAIRRMTYEAHSVRAHGVVGVAIEQRAYAWSGRVLEFLALGTAVRGDVRATVRPVRAVVPLDAPSRRAAEIRVDVAPLPNLGG